jgi:hypothetical protein
MSATSSELERYERRGMGSGTTGSKQIKAGAVLVPTVVDAILKHRYGILFEDAFVVYRDDRKSKAETLYRVRRGATVSAVVPCSLAVRPRKIGTMRYVLGSTLTGREHSKHDLVSSSHLCSTCWCCA